MTGMKINRHKIGYVLLCIMLLSVGVSTQTIKIRDYYPIADGNEWRYTAPPGWKDGDYVSQMKIGELMALVDGSYGDDHTRLDKPGF